MKQYVEQGTRIIVEDIEAFEYSGRNNNFTNDNVAGFNANNEAFNISEGTVKTGQETRSGRNIRQDNENIDELENSNQSSFSMPKTATIDNLTYDVQGAEVSPYQRNITPKWDIDSIQKQLYDTSILPYHTA